MPFSVRQRYNDLLAQRAGFLDAANAALEQQNLNESKAQRAKAEALNAELDELQAQISEESRYNALHAPVLGGERRDMEEMGKMLASGESVRINLNRHLRPTDSTTVATGTLTQPQGSGINVREGFTGQVSSLIDQVTSIDLTGLTGYEEPYVVAPMEAQGADVATAAGTARTASDPTFAKAALAPYELSVTSFVDKNLGRLNPADYAAKVEAMAIRALRRKANGCIINGDGAASPKMFGINNAKNTDGAAIYASVALGAALGVDSLDKLVYAYGGNEELGGNARLLLTKANLQALGNIRGTNEKRRLFAITPDASNPNTGTITDGGLVVPYTLVSSIGNATLAYGDPANYELGLFGEFVIQVDPSVKAIERMNTILGDAMVGGNLVVDKGFVIGTIGA